MNLIFCRINSIVAWSLTETRYKYMLYHSSTCCLLLMRTFVQLCLNLFKKEFIEIATKLSAVVACRCSPTQKADVARLIRSHTRKRVCCIGDGGNDVSMIQAADIGSSLLFSPTSITIAKKKMLNLFSQLRCWYRRQRRKTSLTSS